MDELQTLARRPLLTVGEGRFLVVESHTVAFPDGHIVDDWAWVITPDFINVAAVTA